METKMVQPTAAKSPFLLRAMQLLGANGYDSKEIIRNFSLDNNSIIRFSSYSSPEGRIVKMEIELPGKRLGLRWGMDRNSTRKLVLDGDSLRLITNAGVIEVSTQIDKKNANDSVFELPVFTDEPFAAKEYLAQSKKISNSPTYNKTLDETVNWELGAKKEDDVFTLPMSEDKINSDKQIVKREATD